MRRGGKHLEARGEIGGDRSNARKRFDSVVWKLAILPDH